jgi:hypothetical protein
MSFLKPVRTVNRIDQHFGSAMKLSRNPIGHCCNGVFTVWVYRLEDMKIECATLFCAPVSPPHFTNSGLLKWRYLSEELQVKEDYNRFATLGSTTIPFGRRTTKSIWRMRARSPIPPGSAVCSLKAFGTD